MSGESTLIESLRRLAVHHAARGLRDDAAVLEVQAGRLVLTHDMLVEGVHFLPSDPAGDVAWKLLAVNLSDLAAMGARPLGVLMGYMLGGDGGWEEAFVAGLGKALQTFDVPLLGGDTTASPGLRSFGMTAIGEASGPVPSRSGAGPGDLLWVTGSIGDAGAGLSIARGEEEGPAALVERYRLPRPRLEAGQALAPLVSAMMDVSDGLLIDAHRIAAASTVEIALELGDVPLSDALLAFRGDGLEPRLAAVTAGDDYELLFTAPAEASAEILGLSNRLGLPLSRIGEVRAGSGLVLSHRGAPVPLPERLGYLHG